MLPVSVSGWYKLPPATYTYLRWQPFLEFDVNEQLSAGSALMNTYGERTTTLVKGEGARVWDDQGKQYLDALCGIAVTGLGHNHLAVTEAICEQAQTLLHTSNLFNIKSQQALADKLRDVSGMDKVFFSNSGAEANEAAIKIARKYGHDNGIHDPQIITMSNSFHGRTMATLTATGNQKVKKGFEPLVSGFIHVPFNDVDALAMIGKANKNVVAVLVEPVQGEGGVFVPAPDYLNKLRELCTANNWLLMLDEVQTGNGRNGAYFSYQLNGITPDVVTTAKGLGNGLPLGACLASGKAATTFQPGNHGSTFGGNPLVCHGALAVVNTIIDNNLCHRAAQLGDSLVAKLRDQLKDCPEVKEVRGKGLMIGIELTCDCGDLVDLAKQQGLIINVTKGDTIRLLPPLTLTDAEADELISILCPLIKAFCQQES